MRGHGEPALQLVSLPALRVRTRMHREISHVDQAFARRSNLPLYVLTALIGAILAVHLWPDFVRLVGGERWGLSTWPQKIYGYDIAFFAAVIGGARILYG